MCLPGLLRQWSVVQNARPLARARLEGKPDQRTETRGPEGAQAHEIHTTRSNENSPSLGSGGDPEVGSFLLIRLTSQPFTCNCCLFLSKQQLDAGLTAAPLWPAGEGQWNKGKGYLLTFGLHLLTLCLNSWSWHKIGYLGPDLC